MLLLAKFYERVVRSWLQRRYVHKLSASVALNAVLRRSEELNEILIQFLNENLPSYKLFESPIFALNESVSALWFHRFGLFSFRI